MLCASSMKLKRTKKLKKNGGKYKHKHNKKNSNGKKQGKTIKHKVMKNSAMQKSSIPEVQEGGTNNGNCKEKFEVKRLADIDYSQLSLTKYLNADTDWGNSPGPPPMDCCIM